MQIIVNTEKLKLTASNLESIISDLSEKRNTLIQIQSSLDYSIRYRSNINQTITQLSSRLYEAKLDLNRIKSFLNTTANKYEAAEESITRALNKMEQLTGCSVNGTNLNSIGAIQGSAETKPKWYQTAGKFLVGTGVIVGAGAIAFFGSGIVATLGGAALVGSAIGATIGLASSMIQGKTLDEIASDFMSGSLSGAITGAIEHLIPGSGCITGALVGAGTGFITNTVENLLAGKSLLDGLGAAMLTGVVMGAVTKTSPYKNVQNKVNNFSSSVSDKILRLYSTNVGSNVTNSNSNAIRTFLDRDIEDFLPAGLLNSMNTSIDTSIYIAQKNVLEGVVDDVVEDIYSGITSLSVSITKAISRLLNLNNVTSGTITIGTAQSRYQCIG